jgi:dihydrofolate reductase
MARNRTIGLNNQMPWHLPEDLAHFKHTTMGAPVIMGRKTFDSILASLGRPLPGRRNIVISRNLQWQHAGAETAHSLALALGLVQQEAEVFVIGGGQLYAEALPLAQRLVVTEIDAEFAGDTFFPQIDADEWQKTAHVAKKALAPNNFDFAFVTYERSKNKLPNKPS